MSLLACAGMCGTERLFDVNASNMPAVPLEFTLLLTIMIADRLAERYAALGLGRQSCW